jgi:hypothetical protein
MSLVLDEFALILHLQDVYWNGEGQLSVEALFGLFLPPVAWTGAVRLARPTSIWARHRYHGERMDRAVARATAFDRRWTPVQTDWEDFIGGRPSLAGPAPPRPETSGRRQP